MIANICRCFYISISKVHIYFLLIYSIINNSYYLLFETMMFMSSMYWSDPNRSWGMIVFLSSFNNTQNIQSVNEVTFNKECPLNRVWQASQQHSFKSLFSQTAGDFKDPRNHMCSPADPFQHDCIVGGGANLCDLYIQWMKTKLSSIDIVSVYEVLFWTSNGWNCSFFLEEDYFMSNCVFTLGVSIIRAF